MRYPQAVRAPLLVLSLLVPSVASAGDQTSEDQRIRNHLTLVHSLLETRDTTVMSLEQRARRTTQLARLRAYIERGAFPINTRHPDQRVPYFVDDDDNACAVAQLLIDDGEEELVAAVVASNNHVYVGGIDDTRFDRWVTNSGLTKDELALIQPTYGWTYGTVDKVTYRERGDVAEVRIEVSDQKLVRSLHARWTERRSGQRRGILTRIRYARLGKKFRVTGHALATKRVKASYTPARGMGAHTVSITIPFKRGAVPKFEQQVRGKVLVITYPLTKPRS